MLHPVQVCEPIPSRDLTAVPNRITPAPDPSRPGAHQTTVGLAELRRIAALRGARSTY
jgi:hypothetical protein